MLKRLKNERGFTMIELFYTIGIVTAMSAISLQAYAEFTQDAYDAHSDQLLRDTQLALEAGQSDLDNPVDFFWAWTDDTGTLQGWRIDEFLPGVTVTADTRVDANYDGWCAAFANSWCPGGGMCCVTAWVNTRHCKGNFVKSWMRWNDGTIVTSEWSNWGC